MAGSKKGAGKDIDSAIVEVGSFLEINIPEKEIYLDPWLRSESISLISADRGTGKTWFAMSVGMAVVKEQAFGPWGAGASVPVLYIEGEMAAVDVQERLLYLDGNGQNANPFYVYSEAYANQLGIRRAHLLDPEWQAKMKTILIKRKVKLFIIDNISSLSPGIDENAKKDWDPINQWLLELRFAGISSILLHHTNKGGGQRGTQGRTDNIDVSMMLTRPPGYETVDGAKFICSFDKNRIQHADLPKIVDTEFQLTQDEHKDMIWTWSNPKKDLKIKIMKLKDEGYTDDNISKELGCTRQNVSKTILKLMKDGYLSKKKKLTQSGFEYVEKYHNEV